MKRIFLSIFLFIGLCFSINVLAQQSGGGLDSVCTLSGGTWTGSESGNWACCWADWGCYGCHSGVCKMQCRTKRCRKANQMHKANSKQEVVKGLAPKGMSDPIAPQPKKVKHY